MRTSCANAVAIPILLIVAVALGGLTGFDGRGAVAQGASPAPQLIAELGGDGKLTECVDPSFPPMEFYRDQNAKTPVGFDIDLTTEIAKRRGVELEVVPSEFTGLLPALQAGRCDIVASGVYLTAKRLETFAAQPYYDTSVVLVTLAKTAGIAAPEDLSGKTIAVQSGTNYINILNDLNAALKRAGKPEVNVQTYPKQTDAIQQLVVGRADATITQDTEAAYRDTAQPGQFKTAYTYPNPETFGIYHRQGDAALAAALKQTVEAMRDDGTLAKIAKTWNLPEKGAAYSQRTFSATPAASPAA